MAFDLGLFFGEEDSWENGFMMSSSHAGVTAQPALRGCFNLVLETLDQGIRV